MRINWIFDESYNIDPTFNVDQIKNIGPTWGSWRTWRSCSTDNVVCHDRAKAQTLLERAFQAVCNFHIPKKYYADLGRPIGVKLYEGDFDYDIMTPENIIALHLAQKQSDIMLVVGFDLGPIVWPEDKYDIKLLKDYHGMLRSLIVSDMNVQWVLVDHAAELDKAYKNLPNLTCDKFENVLKLLV